jgi:cytochrome P450
MNELLRQLVAAYREQGPVFRFKRDGGEIVVLAGPSANTLLAQSGSRYFSNEQMFGEFARELGADNFIVAMDGPRHRQMRASMKPAFSPDAVTRYIPELLRSSRRELEKWPPGSRLEMVDTFRRTIAEQTTRAMLGHSASADFEHIFYFFQKALNVLVARSEPKSELQTIEYLFSKSRVFSNVGKIIDDHRAAYSEGPPDFIDCMLDAKYADGSALAENDLRAAALVPFFAGLDTVANACANMLYALLHNRDVLRRIRTEVELPFSKDTPTIEELKQLTYLYGSVLETLRMYPVAPSAARYVIETFEFAGHLIEAGQPVLIATPVTNMLEEIFPDPFRFDPMRFFPPRNEHRAPGVFAPFLKGPHLCLGAGLAEVQVMLTLGAIIHHASLELCESASPDPKPPELIPQHGGAYEVLVMQTRGQAS